MSRFSIIRAGKISFFLLLFLLSFFLKSQDNGVINNIYPELIKYENAAVIYVGNIFNGEIIVGGYTEAETEFNTTYREPFVAEISLETGEVFRYETFSNPKTQYNMVVNSKYCAKDSMLFMPVERASFNPELDPFTSGVLVYNSSTDSLFFIEIPKEEKAENYATSTSIGNEGNYFFAYGFSNIDSFEDSIFVGRHYRTYRIRYSYSGKILSYIITDSVYIDSKDPDYSGTIITGALKEIDNNRFLQVQHDGVRVNPDYLYLTDSLGNRMWRTDINQFRSNSTSLNTPLEATISAIYMGQNKALKRIQPSGLFTLTNAVVYKLDYSGNFIDSLIIDTTILDTRFNYTKSLRLDSNGDLVLLANDEQFYVWDTASALIHVIDTQNMELLENREYRFKASDTITCYLNGIEIHYGRIFGYGHIQAAYGYGNYRIPWIVYSDTNYCILPNCSDTTLSVPEAIAENEIVVYPNPFQDELVIEFNDFQNLESIEILNTSGQRVFFSTEPKQIIDLNHLKSGVYILIFSMNDDALEYHKIIKQ